MLREFDGKRNGSTHNKWAKTKLAEQLAERGDLAELAARVAAGDIHAATVLADWAQQGKLSNAEQFLLFGLAPDGSFRSARL